MVREEGQILGGINNCKTEVVPQMRGNDAQVMGLAKYDHDTECKGDGHFG